MENRCQNSCLNPSRSIALYYSGLANSTQLLCDAKFNRSLNSVKIMIHRLVDFSLSASFTHHFECFLRDWSGQRQLVHKVLPCVPLKVEQGEKYSINLTNSQNISNVNLSLRTRLVTLRFGYLYKLIMFKLRDFLSDYGFISSE
jgi:hypothetical protein